MKNLLFLFIGILLFSSCNNNNSVNNQQGKQKISFSNLQVGQESKYIYLKGEDYRNPDSSKFRYYKDTLIVQVVDKNDSGYTIKEFLSPYSEVFNGGIGPNYNSIIYYTVRIENDTIFFISDTYYLHSYLLGVYYMNPFILSANDFFDQYINIFGWKTDLPYKENYRQGYTENYELFSEMYDRLNIIVNNGPMARDGGGKTYVYSLKYGIVKTSQYSWWWSNGDGWDLLGK
ncbi:MAG: hypothetical protein A2X61_14745 [Ignavibacteria bacterium GWB2_35_12]|nr:MAG: hypothetical protein A2X63_06675 [Ignavibacteria bacterium GWA2_35_8]OGU38339.1 MAG: hypothetical protein A2X61_14745 [Ignavibacteria bacterium GWB2_35_12]OGV23425.1 MAG: hypothetical protein A2475_06510 [Ignavibacteria bacterium RIFOXYC2_FULL_35_21]